MPWRIQKKGNEWCLIKISTGKTEWCHKDKKHVIAGMRAKYAGESKDK